MSHFEDKKQFEDLLDFTKNLVRSTRSQLSKSQVELVADDLIDRAVRELYPLKKRQSVDQACSSATLNSGNTRDKNGSTEGYKMRQHKCKTCGKPPPVLYQPMNVTVSEEYIPNEKRRRRTCPSPSQNDSGKSTSELNVFEKLYALRKTHNVANDKGKKKMSAAPKLACTDSKDQKNLDNSIKHCFGSIQKALDNLKLSSDVGSSATLGYNPNVNYYSTSSLSS
ncbi:unnamed protein product [Phyllotreta striolata]|uniref:Uncharacterized protein n=1 Tax=Phyllotreta striolata TaxID=444603 RepID=A0A9N9XSA7_PHYSR|nr:unnamed protein product [Phyllotreta striolata]